MPSFDIVSKVDLQEVDNAINNAIKEIATRYDFRNAKTEINLDKKEKSIHIVAADKAKMEAVREIIISKAIKRKLDPKVFDFADPTPTTGMAFKRDVKIKEGIPQDTAKKAVKMIKDSKLKVQASILGEELRISGKSINDLQAVIALMRGAGLGLPLQFVNMKS